MLTEVYIYTWASCSRLLWVDIELKIFIQVNLFFLFHCARQIIWYHIKSDIAIILLSFEASRKLFVTRWTIWPTKLGFFVGHFSYLSSKNDLQAWVFADILSDDPGACRRTFSQIIRHDQRDQWISGSLSFLEFMILENCSRYHIRLGGSYDLILTCFLLPRYWCK